MERRKRPTKRDKRLARWFLNLEKALRWKVRNSSLLSLFLIFWPSDFSSAPERIAQMRGAFSWIVFMICLKLNSAMLAVGRKVPMLLASDVVSRSNTFATASHWITTRSSSLLVFRFFGLGDCDMSEREEKKEEKRNKKKKKFPFLG